MDGGNRPSHVSRATYPLPQPLVERLEAGIQCCRGDTMASANAAPLATTAAAMAATASPFSDASGGAPPPVLLETPPEALGQLVSNAIESMDRMYFATPARIRTHPAFQHRLCLRVCANPAAQTLSITDLGAGMTRTDLINSLGTGRAGLLPTSSSQLFSATSSSSTTTSSSSSIHGLGGTTRPTISTSNSVSHETTDESTTDQDDDEEDDDEDYEDLRSPRSDNSADVADEGGQEVVGNDVHCLTELERDDKKALRDASTEERTNGEYEGPGTHTNDSRWNHGVKEPLGSANGKSHANNATTPPLDCRAGIVGGFYAAFCALGTGVRVATKAKFDDYYEFEIAFDKTLHQEGYSLQEFCVSRPREEGAQLTAENGFNLFHHIRGDSGTCVTVRLNQRAISEGFLDETKLKPLLLKIVETTQYTVAFSSDENAQEIIAASAKEIIEMQHLAMEDNQQYENLDTAVDMDVNDDTSVSHNSVLERAKYIPLRLSLAERKMLRLVEAAMNCCDYTTQVDRQFKSAARRTHEQLKGVTSVLRGLVTACDYEAGQQLLKDDNYSEYESFFRQMFEIARRHKIMNPEKMRTEYGKLIYLLQDAVSPSVKPHLGFSVKRPIESVYKFLQERGGENMLADKLIEMATEEILAGNKSRAVIDQEIRQKERAVNILKRKYQSSRLSADDIHLCLYSICDNNSFLNSNRVPIDKIIDYLSSHFSPQKMEDGYSLAIISGEDGARLSHSHERQYYYALQSLTLWRDIIDDMFRLWAMAEEDLLSETISYSLQDTGQGMQRVQQSPRAYKAMQQVLIRVQTNVGHWVGSSVIHMGDHNVPNALSFIDKYTQGMSLYLVGYLESFHSAIPALTTYRIYHHFLCLAYSSTNSWTDCNLSRESGTNLQERRWYPCYGRSWFWRS